MIVRAWRGRASTAKPQAYPDHFDRNVLPELRGIDGFFGASLLREDHGDHIEFLVLTRWQSMAAIRTFAGEEVDLAVVEPEAIAALESFDTRVHHYSVVTEA